MAHLSIRLKDTELAFLKAEAERQGRDVSYVLRDLIQQACRPADPARLEKIAALQVLILDTKDGRYLVSPDDPADFSTVQLWVKANLVSFDRHGFPLPESAQAIFEQSRTPIGLRLNKDAVEPAQAPVSETLQSPGSDKAPALESKRDGPVPSKDGEDES